MLNKLYLYIRYLIDFKRKNPLEVIMPTYYRVDKDTLLNFDQFLKEKYELSCRWVSYCDWWETAQILSKKEGIVLDLMSMTKTKVGKIKHDTYEYSKMKKNGIKVFFSFSHLSIFGNTYIIFKLDDKDNLINPVPNISALNRKYKLRKV